MILSPAVVIAETIWKQASVSVNWGSIKQIKNVPIQMATTAMKNTPVDFLIAVVVSLLPYASTSLFSFIRE